HSGQRRSHLDDCAPQDWQAKTVATRGDKGASAERAGGAGKVLDVVVSPPDAGAEEERVLLGLPVEEVVPARREEDRRREVVASGYLPVRVEVGTVEVPDLRREAEPVLQEKIV